MQTAKDNKPEGEDASRNWVRFDTLLANFLKHRNAVRDMSRQSTT